MAEEEEEFEDVLLSAVPSKISEINTSLEVSPDYDELCELIQRVFSFFDMENKNRIDLREVGPVLRCLGLIPTEADVQDIISEVEEEESEGYVEYSRFFPALMKRLNERSFFPLEFDELMEVFKVLDEEGKGYLTKEQITNFMSENGIGEPLDEFELDDMLVASVDRETGNVDCPNYIAWLLNDDEVGVRVRKIIDNHLETIRLAREEAERIAAELAAEEEEEEDPDDI